MLCNSTSCGVWLFSNPHSKVIFGSVYIGVLWHQVKKIYFPFQIFQNVSVQHDSLYLSRAFAPVVSGIAFLPLNAHPH